MSQAVPVDHQRRTVAGIYLSPILWRLGMALAEARGRVVPHETLIAVIEDERKRRGMRANLDKQGAAWSAMKKLRKALAGRVVIRPVYGEGYVMRVSSESDVKRRAAA